MSRLRSSHIKKYIFLIILLLFTSNYFEIYPIQSRIGEEWIRTGLYFKYVLTETREAVENLISNHSKTRILSHIKNIYNKTPVFLFSFTLVNISKKSSFGYEICWGGADNISLLINILNVSKDYFIAEIKIVFKNMILVCNEDIGFQEVVKVFKNIEFKTKDEFFYIEPVNFTFLNFVKVSRINHDVINIQYGARLGEWIFWLNPNELKANSTAILLSRYCIGSCLASILCLSNEKTGSKNYVINDTIIDKTRTIIGNDIKCSIRYGTIWYNLTEDEKIQVKMIANRLYPNFKFFDFNNGTVAVLNTSLYRTYKKVASLKPWKLYIKQGRKYSGRQVSYIYVIKYDKEFYEVLPLNWVYMVYERSHGILLEIKPTKITYLKSMFHGYYPFLSDSIIVDKDRRLIIELYSSKKDSLSLELKDTNLSLKTEMIGSIGRIEWNRLILYIAFLTIILILSILENFKKKMKRDENQI